MEVSDARGISAAAHRVHLSQPAVTQAISGLEQRFGTRLLDRRREGMFPTEAGEVLLTRVRRMFATLADGAAQAVRLATRREGRPAPDFHTRVTSAQLRALIAIRDAESRTRFLGYRVEHYKLVVWTLSACMAGIAGALYVPQVGIINPGEFEPANSIEVVIWVAVGGRGLLVGPIVGAILVNFAKTWFTSGALAPYWLFVLGGIFVAVTLFLPRGIVGTLAGYFSRERRASPPAAEAPAPNEASAAAESGVS